MYCIYNRPSDHPEHEYIVRRLWVTSGDVAPREVIGFADTLEEARLLVPADADVCFPRDVGDEPQIVETWF